jgi:hypothetical protein
MRGAVGFNEMGDAMAEVFNIWTKTDGRYHTTLNYNFDPATDEVIVVKKDAVRVWVEGMERVRFLHTSLPTWRGGSWRDSVDCDSIGGLLPCIANHDCVEFVAVKTHRPPVAQEVAEPVAESVPELSDEAKVKAVYPKAYYAFSGNIWEEDSATARQLSLQFARADLAWADAARRLNAETKPESISHHNFGCGVNVVSGAVLAN